jgi:hypothetical protein
MRRVSLLMVLAVAAFMSLGATGAMAAGKAGAKPTTCKHAKGKKECKRPKPKPRDECQYGKDPKTGMCLPKPDECPYGKDPKDGTCLPKPIVVPPPSEGPCSQADLVLLEDLLKGTGALLCVYLGDNAPNATADLDCPDSLLALPLDNLVGACLYLPPAEVSPSEEVAPTVEQGTVATKSQVKAIDTETSSVGGLSGLLSTLTGLLKLGSS